MANSLTMLEGMGGGGFNDTRRAMQVASWLPSYMRGVKIMGEACSRDGGR